MIKNSEIDKEKNLLIEDFARILANQKPKETNFNNTKTRKYFENKVFNDNESNTNTILDTLLVNEGTKSMSTSNKTDSLISSIFF